MVIIGHDITSKFILGLSLWFQFRFCVQIYLKARRFVLCDLKSLNELYPNKLNDLNYQGFVPLLLAANQENRETVSYLVDNVAHIDVVSQ